MCPARAKPVPAPLLTVPSFLCSSPHSVFSLGGCLCSSVSISLPLFISPLSAPSLSAALPSTFLSLHVVPSLSVSTSPYLSVAAPRPSCSSWLHPHFFLPLSAVSWLTPLVPTVGLSPRSWEAQRECAGQGFTGGPWEPRMRGSPPRPHPERGREGAARLWPVWPEGSDSAVAWSPPAPKDLPGCYRPRAGAE